MVKLLRPRASRRWDWTSYGCDRQKKGRPGDLRDTMIAGIALAHHATLATRNTAYFEGGVQIEASEVGRMVTGTMSEKYAITAYLDWDTDKTDEENIAAATGERGQ